MEDCKERGCRKGMGGEGIGYELGNEFGVRGIVFVWFLVGV